MFNNLKFIGDCRLIRQQSPLILNITNYVAMTPTANALLAIGASPIMSFCPDEMVDLVSSCSAVVINLGCPDKQLAKAARIAAAAAVGSGKPWVLDPVGAGASGLRDSISADLASNYHPSVIRGNASEVVALASITGMAESSSGRGRGVDSTMPSGLALMNGRALAKGTGAIVSISGEHDYITDSDRVCTISNGTLIMPKVTAMGCTATAVTAAFLAVDPDCFNAASGAMALMGVCGDIATESCRGTGSFHTAFLDALSTMDPEDIAERVREQEGDFT